MKMNRPIHSWACALIAATTFCYSILQAEDRSFLVFSDIHFNVYYDLDKAQFQELAGLDVDQWPSFFRALDQPVVELGSDSNYTLMVSALAAAAKRMPDSPFVIFPGDFMGHDWQVNYNGLAAETLEENPRAFRDFTTKALQLIANEFQKAFPNSAILPTLGNDDSFCQDYWIQPQGEFLAAFANIWHPLLSTAADPDDFRESFSALGCFTADLPTLPNHQLISLNSIFWSDSYCDAYHDPVTNKTNCCGCTNAGDAPGKAQFSWLEKQLKGAAAAGKKVWLLMHVPPGLDSYKEEQAGGANVAAHLWTTGFTQQYLTLVAQYRDTLQLSFAGHTHTDDYRVDKVDGEPVLFHKIVPAISPIYGNNPAIQVYHVDSESGVLNNWQTRFLSLKQANGGTPTKVWTDEYDAQKSYGLKIFNAETVAGLFEGIAKDPAGPHSAAYRLFYQVSAHEIPQPELPVYTCAILNATFVAYHTCLTGHGLPAPVQMKSPAELRRLAGGLPPPGSH